MQLELDKVCRELKIPYSLKSNNKNH